jgi:MFS superfamily sulfate permease-like transporter
MKTIDIPKDGLAGFKQNWTHDALAGFLVFLLALPLSLGIARASEFPPAMGVLTAMVGGLFVSFFAGSKLTIKGPAAGLITICAGAVTELGGGTQGWHLALGVIVVASIIQIGLGLLKVGSLSDFFPHSAVHGMLAAIGLIIFSKQIHILLGIDPATLKGLEPLELFSRIPDSFIHEDFRVTLVGVVSLIIIFGMPLLKGRVFKKIPATMVVLVVTVPMALIMDFRKTEPAFDLVKIGDFWGTIGLNADFSAIGSWVFWKYVFMFLFVNSLESLLTVKAIDGLDPWKRKSNPSKDLTAVGAGNALASLFGGLPMISEVARSSANISFGGRTRWANFFHGFFLLVAMLLFIPVIEMIPNAALAALLIAVGYRLASPKEFFKVYRIGSDQLFVFVITIIVTIATDLLIGIGAGIVTKFIVHIFNGAPIKTLFKSNYEISNQGDQYLIKIKGTAIFSNYLGFQKAFDSIPHGKNITFNFSAAQLIDHTFMEGLHHFEEEYHQTGGTISLIGMNKLKTFSDHPTATRRAVDSGSNKLEITLTSRQVELIDFAEANEYNFYPQKVRNSMKYKDFPIQQGNKLLYEENLMEKYLEAGKITISDLALTEGALQEKRDTHITMVHVTETGHSMPDFALEPEGLWTKLTELSYGKDIDFHEFPDFSKKYYLYGTNEKAIRNFFNESIVHFFEIHHGIHVECHKNKLVIYKRRDILDSDEIILLEKFAEELLEVIDKTRKK